MFPHKESNKIVKGIVAYTAKINKSKVKANNTHLITICDDSADIGRVVSLMVRQAATHLRVCKKKKKKRF